MGTINKIFNGMLIYSGLTMGAVGGISTGFILADNLGNPYRQQHDRIEAKQRNLASLARESNNTLGYVPKDVQREIQLVERQANDFYQSPGYQAYWETFNNRAIGGFFLGGLGISLALVGKLRQDQRREQLSPLEHVVDRLV